MQPASNTSPRSVLFLCSMNAVRSPMAEAILRHLAASRVRVASAGVRPQYADPFTYAVMAEAGIDIGAHQPMSIDDVDVAGYDLVVALSADATKRIQVALGETGPTLISWLVPDVAAGAEKLSREARLKAYRDVRDILFHRIRTELSGLLAHAV